jgi:primosomal protein N' (replication factor Y)
MARAAPKANGARIMGPVMAQIYMARNWYRMRFLVSGDARAHLQPLVRLWMSRIHVPANVRIKLDVNPMNFM